MFGRKRRPKLLFCSFCGKDSSTVKALIAGPTVFICDACVATCNKILSGEPVPKPEPEWDKLPDDHVLKSLGFASALAGAAADLLRLQVGILRRRGVKWAAIGKALGVSRQAAWERFR
jgi:hypothetical protein